MNFNSDLCCSDSTTEKACEEEAKLLLNNQMTPTEEEEETTASNPNPTGTMRIQLSFELRDLINTHTSLRQKYRGERTCPYVIVSTMDDSVKLGKTETAWNSLATKFSTPIFIDYTPGSTPYIKVRIFDNQDEQKTSKQNAMLRMLTTMSKSFIYGQKNWSQSTTSFANSAGGREGDEESGGAVQHNRQSMASSRRSLDEMGTGSKDLLLCEHTLDLTEFRDEILKGSFGLKEMKFFGGDVITKRDEEQFKNLSHLTICGHQSDKIPHTTPKINLQFRALKIKNVEKGYFNLQRTDPYYTITKKHDFVNEAKTHWQRVYKSKYLLDHLNPLWEPTGALDLELLCDGNYKKELCIELWDYDESGKDVLVAKTKADDVLTLETLFQKASMGKGNANKDKAFEMVVVEKFQKVGMDRSAGHLVVLKAEEVFPE
jgi:hypothetical protein